MYKLFRRFYITTSTIKTQCVVLDRLDGKDKGIFVVSINRPDVKNAVNRNTIDELSTILEQVNYNEDAKVLIFRSKIPGIFCSGADLKERLSLTQPEVSHTVSKFRSVNNQLESLSIPVIAALDGIALGGGFEIALSCDIRVGSTNTKLGLVETKLAIIPGAGGTQRLPRLIGSSVAKELIFTGRIINGNCAKQYGILNHLVEQNQFCTAAYEKSLSISREILPNGPMGIKMAKVAINRGLQVDVNSGCAIEESCYAQVIPTKDRIEGLNAFLNKRTPNYTGE